MFFKRRFKTWKTIALGTGLKMGADFHRALISSGYKIGGWGTNAILDNSSFTVASRLTKVALVNVSVRDLGFYRKRGRVDDILSATIDEIYNRAQEYELGICPIEVGPQLRSQYPDQPPPKEPGDQVLYIGMYPINLKREECYGLDDNNPFIFDVTHQKDGLYLRATPAPLRQIHHTCRFVFLQSHQDIAL